MQTWWQISCEVTHIVWLEKIKRLQDLLKSEVEKMLSIYSWLPLDDRRGQITTELATNSKAAKDTSATKTLE